MYLCVCCQVAERSVGEILGTELCTYREITYRTFSLSRLPKNLASSASSGDLRQPIHKHYFFFFLVCARVT